MMVVPVNPRMSKNRKIKRATRTFQVLVEVVGVLVKAVQVLAEPVQVLVGAV
jgi:hypothetical protein